MDKTTVIQHFIPDECDTKNLLHCDKLWFTNQAVTAWHQGLKALTKCTHPSFCRHASSFFTLVGELVGTMCLMATISSGYGFSWARYTVLKVPRTKNHRIIRCSS